MRQLYPRDMRPNPFVALIGFLVCGPGIAQGTAIDRFFAKSGDITGDGSQSTLTLHITGESMSASFKWSLTISDSHGAMIYRVNRDDTRLDHFFRDDGYVTGCTGYENCKKRYYFHDLPERIFASLVPSSQAWARLSDENVSRDIRETATRYLQAQGLPDRAISGAINEICSGLQKPGYRQLIVPISAVQDAPPMIWVASVRLFVPFYED